MDDKKGCRPPTEAETALRELQWMSEKIQELKGMKQSKITDIELSFLKKRFEVLAAEAIERGWASESKPRK